MNEYETDQLKNYIEESKLVVINEDFKIRLSKELFQKYEKGHYTKELKLLEENIKQINGLHIKYPASAHPIFYLYIVPNENFKTLLHFQTNRSTESGGRPVSSYDLDGFHVAYGISSNMLESRGETSIMDTVSSIHELSHLVHSMFFRGNRFIQEGFAEALPLYTMNYESDFEEHRELLKHLEKKQILSAEDLIELEEKGSFNTDPLIPNASCSFELPYISSYLFVRGCLETIANKFSLNRVEATQRFLEILLQSECSNQWLVFDIANAIGVSQEELLNNTDMQFEIINHI